MPDHLGTLHTLRVYVQYGRLYWVTVRLTATAPLICVMATYTSCPAIVSTSQKRYADMHVLPIPYIVFVVIPQLLLFRNSDPGSYIGHPSPLRYFPSLLSRETISTFSPRPLASKWVRVQHTERKSRNTLVFSPHIACI